VKRDELGQKDSEVIYSRLSQSISANGDSGEIDIADFERGVLSVHAISVTGTNPTLDVYYDQQDADGNWLLALVSLTQLTSAPNYAYAAIGASGGYPMGTVGRIRWVVGGTTPVWTNVDISFIGR
jgi:hypothetical protein